MYYQTEEADRCVLKQIFNEKFVVPGTRILPIRRTRWETKISSKGHWVSRE